jgi:hypothetical protein
MNKSLWAVEIGYYPKGKGGVHEGATFDRRPVAIGGLGG